MRKNDNYLILLFIFLLVSLRFLKQKTHFLREAVSLDIIIVGDVISENKQTRKT